MGSVRCIPLAALALLGAGFPAAAGELSSAGFRLPAATLSGGGAIGMRSETGGDMFGHADASIGQAPPLGVQRDAAGAVVVPGFWAAAAEESPPPPPPCVGDCNGDGEVTVDELVRGVNIALGNAALSVCPALDGDADGMVAINELVRAVGHALSGCPTA